MPHHYALSSYHGRAHVARMKGVIMRKNEASWVESRKRWQINVQSDGIRRTFSSSTPGRKGKIEAERKADKWLEEKTVSDNTRCDVLLDKFLGRIKATTSRANWRPMESRISNHIRPAIGFKRIGKLNENDLQNIIEDAYAAGLSKRGLKNVKSDITAFMKFCRQEKATRLLPENLRIPTGAKRSKKTVATQDDLKKLFQSEETTWQGRPCADRYIHAYRFLVLTGLRPGEMLGLRWEDITGNKVRIRRSLNDDNELTEGKNDNARRPFKIVGLAAEELKRQREMLQREGVISPYVFPTKKGTPTSQDTFRSFWKRYRTSNGISPVTPYEMRHTFVSVNKEMPEGLKKMVVGHSKDMDTEGTYGHEMAGDMDKAAAYSDAAFKRILAK